MGYEEFCLRVRVGGDEELFRGGIVVFLRLVGEVVGLAMVGD
jgi:hypothetical protein